MWLVGMGVCCVDLWLLWRAGTEVWRRGLMGSEVNLETDKGLLNDRWVENVQI